MNVPSLSNYASVGANATDGIQQQQRRLQQNVHTVAQGENSDGFNAASRDRALVEQNQIVQAVKANARTLQVAEQMLGTIIDIKV